MEGRTAMERPARSLMKGAPAGARPELRDDPAGRHAGARPVVPEESRFVRGLMAALLPAGLLWLMLISLLRGLRG